MSKYKDVDLQEVEYLIKVRGYNDEQLINHLQIASSTFYKWKKNKKEFSEAIKKGKIKLVALITNSLIDRTQGKYIEEKKDIVLNGKKETLVTKKWAPASDTAIIFALCNFDPKYYQRGDKTIQEKKDKIDIGNVHAEDISELERRILNEDF